MTDMSKPKKPEPQHKTADDIRILVDLVVRASGAFEQACAHRVDATPLTITQWSALDVICRGKADRPYLLGKALKLSRQRAWQISKKLEANGLVEMQSVEPNSQAILLTATAAGRHAHESFSTEIFSRLADFFNKEMPVLNLGGSRVALRTMIGACDSLAQEGEKASQ